jgi:AcrR family transcriptional regulator
MNQTATLSDGSVAGYKRGRVPRAVREQQLLDHAEELLIENGYGGFSIEDLCRAAGVSRPIVYDHFGSKDGVYIACLRRIRGEFEGAIVEAAAGASELAEVFALGVDAFFEILERDPHRWSLVYGPTMLVGPLADELDELRETTVDRIVSLGRAFAPDADPEELAVFAHAASGAGEQVGRWWLDTPGHPRADAVARFESIALALIADAVRRGGLR